MLGKVVAARELLATFVAFKRLIMSMKGSVVALEVFLSAESARAQGTDKGFGGIFREGLLATTTIDRLDGCRRGVSAGGRGVSVGGTNLALGCS